MKVCSKRVTVKVGRGFCKLNRLEWIHNAYTPILSRYCFWLFLVHKRSSRQDLVRMHSLSSSYKFLRASPEVKLAGSARSREARDRASVCRAHQCSTPLTLPSCVRNVPVRILDDTTPVASASRPLIYRCKT